MRREKEEETEDKDNINLHAPTGRDGEVCSKIATGHGTARRGELELGQVLFNASARCGGYMQETIAAAEAVRTYVRLHADQKKACGMYISCESAWAPICLLGRLDGRRQLDHA
jgi:hypothetical protein